LIYLQIRKNPVGIQSGKKTKCHKDTKANRKRDDQNTVTLWTDRETERQRDRRTERQKDIKTEGQKDNSQSNRHKGKLTYLTKKSK
jgi:hypothetical protein